MSDSLKLLTATEAPRQARAALDEMIRDAPGLARAVLGVPAGEPIAFTERQVLGMARVALVTRAVEVRCTRGCEHSSRFAVLAFGVDCCGGCFRQFSDAERRDDGRCDTCNAVAELEGVEYQLHGGVVLPDGSTEASVLVQANVCGDCLRFLQLVPGSSRAASWN
jgi:hypothetical protein